jgi:hypothetical protein
VRRIESREIAGAAHPVRGDWARVELPAGRGRAIGSDPVAERPGFAAFLSGCEPHGVGVVLVENASRFARDLAVHLTGHALLRTRGIELVPVDAHHLRGWRRSLRKIAAELAALGISLLRGNPTTPAASATCSRLERVGGAYGAGLRGPEWRLEGATCGASSPRPCA